MSDRPLPAHVAAECLPGAGIEGICDRCQSPLPARRQRWCSDECGVEYFYDHSFAFARGYVRRRDDRTCAECGDQPRDGVEVDHIVAARGAHGQHSCVHHRDNLRCLCVPCHKRRTADQRRVTKEGRQ